MNHVFICYVYRFGLSPVIPTEAFCSLEEVVSSLQSKYASFVYNGSSDFKIAENGVQTCTISEDASHNVYVVHKLNLSRLS